ncbi:MAG: hypothetical protein EZS28_020698 [Streblomastix strix]|uniref:Uncharacterized protein n=1 Tax=Streblomastix strix TaxID=222440 RepID=A0A5J4VMW0_9EUKA|nr:MAG: hypothetical protein EZS28_020698 [Streblomastix strix]
MTLGTAQTINANKTFNNACRFVNSIDGMVTITGASFVKSRADNSIVLIGAGGTKPISEFAGTPTDLSDYYTKTQIYSKPKLDNKYVRLECSIQQSITARLKYVSPFGARYDETQDPVANTYLIMSELDSKRTSCDNTVNNQSINGIKIFNANVNVTGFKNSGKDDKSVLLSGGHDALLSSLEGLQLIEINQTNNIVNRTSIMSLKCASSASVAVCTLENAGFPKFGTDEKVTITIRTLTGTAGLAGAASAFINVIYPAAN